MDVPPRRRTRDPSEAREAGVLFGAVEGIMSCCGMLVSILSAIYFGGKKPQVRNETPQDSGRKSGA